MRSVDTIFLAFILYLRFVYAVGKKVSNVEIRSWYCLKLS